MAALPEMQRGYPRGANDGDGGENLLLAWMGGGGVPRQLRDSGRALMMLGALVLTWRRVARCSNDNPEHVLAGFALWLLGAGLAMLSLVARQFPRLAAAGAGLARALRCCLLGGL